MDRTYPGDGAARAVPGVQPGTAKEPRTVAAAVAGGEQLWMRRGADETAWQIGGTGEVAWITENTRPGTTIATAIPPIFAGYATVIVPEPYHEKRNLRRRPALDTRSTLVNAAVVVGVPRDGGC